jgi:lysophospholipase L1-like esterase
MAVGSTWLGGLLIGSLLLNAALIGALIAALLSPPDRLLRCLRRRRIGQRQSFFDGSPVGDGDVVFLGDSLTERGEWAEMFPGMRVRNRGIGGDTTDDVVARIGPIVTGQPGKVFLQIGTNDIWERKSDRQILDNTAQILTAFRTGSPQTSVYVQSLLPRQPRYAARIRRLNGRLQALAERCGCLFIDLYPHFVAADGSLRAEYSNDGLHLLGAGYLVWQGRIAAHVLAEDPARRTAILSR